MAFDDLDPDLIARTQVGQDVPAIAQARTYQGTSLDDLKNVMGESASGMMADWYAWQSKQAATDDWSRYNYAMAEQWRDTAKGYHEAQSQDTQDTVASNWLSKRTWQHPSAKIGTALAQNILPYGAGLAAEAVGGPALAGSMFALQNITGTYGEITDKIQSMSDSQKRATIPEYDDLRRGGASQDDANRVVINHIGRDGHLDELAGAWGLVGGATVFGGMAKGAKPLARMIAGGAEAAGGQAAQDLGTSLAVRGALGGVNVPGQSDEDLAAHAMWSGIGMAPLGVLGGALHGRRPGEEAPPVTEEPPKTQGAAALQGPPTGPALAPPLRRLAGPRYDEPIDTPYTEVPRPGLPAPVPRLGYRGRPTDLPPGADSAPSPQLNVAKRAAAVETHEEPVAGKYSSIEGTGRWGRKDITPTDITPPDVTPTDITPTHVDYTIPSSPVDDASRAALDDTAPNRSAMMRDRHRYATILSQSTGRPYTDFRGMTRAELQQEMDNFHRGLTGPSLEPQPRPVEQPPGVQPTTVGREVPEPTETPPTAPTPDPRTGTPEGGITPASEFASGPKRGYDDRTAAELARYDALQRQVEQLAGAQPQVAARQEAVAARLEAQRQAVQTVPVESQLGPVSPTAMGEALKGIAEHVQRVAAEHPELLKAPRETKEFEEQAPRKWTKAEIAALTSKKRAEDAVVNAREHQPTASDWYAAKPAEAPKGLGVGARTRLIERLQKMVNAYDAAKLKTPEEFRMVPKGGPNARHSALIVDEARRMLNAYKEAGGNPHVDRWNKFVEREQLLRQEKPGETKNYNQVVRMRAKEGEEMIAKPKVGAKGPRVGEKAIEAAETPAAREGIEEEVSKAAEWQKQRELRFMDPLPERPHEDAPNKDWENYKEELLDHPLVRRVVDQSKTFVPEDHGARSDEIKTLHWGAEAYQKQVRETIAAGKPATAKPMADLGAKIAAKEAEALKPEPPKAAAAKKVSFEALKARAAPKEEPVPEPRITKPIREEVGKPERKVELKGKPEEVKPETVTLESARSGGPKTVTPVRETTIQQLIKENLSLSRYPAAIRPIMGKLLNKVLELAGDTKAYVFTDADMRKLDGNIGVRGFFNVKRGQEDYIALHKDLMEPDTAFHEAFHAATAKAIAASKQLTDHLSNLKEEVRAHLNTLPKEVWDTPGLRNAFANVHEFLTYMMTKPHIQDILKGIKISDKLAKDIGMPRWRKKSMWNGVIDIIRQALGMEPRDTSAIEAAMAITERALHPEEKSLFPQTLYERAEDVDDPERIQQAYFKSGREKWNSVKDSLEPNIVKQHASDMAHNIGMGFLHHTVKWLNMDKLHLLHGKAAPYVHQIADIMGKIHSQYLAGRASDLDLRNRSYLLDRMFAHMLPDYDRLLRLTKEHQIDPTLDEQPKEGGLSRAQHDQYWPEAKALYDKLSPEMQQRFKDERDWYRKKNAEAGEQSLRMLVRAHGAPDPDDSASADAFIRRAKLGQLTDDDKDYMDATGSRDRFDQALNRMKGTETYFYTHRNGRWVVHGKFDMHAGGRTTNKVGEALPDDMREFDSEDAARKFMTEDNKFGLHATVRRAFYGTDKETGKYRRMTYEDARESMPAGQKEPDHAFQVRLERSYTDFAKTPAEARRLREAMIKAGIKEENISKPMDRYQDQTWASIGRADQALLEQRIRKLMGVTDTDKQRMIDASREAMLASQSSSLSRMHSLKRRDVVGGQLGNAESLDTYSRMHHHAMAKARVAPELNAALDAMTDHQRANAGDDMATRRSIVNEELKRRLMVQQPLGKQSPIIRNLMNYSFLNFLLRPSHVFLQQMHPWVYSVPQMAARHGLWKTIQAYRQATRDLGGDQAMARAKMLGKSVGAAVDMARALREKDIDKAVQMAHGFDPIKNMMNNLKDENEKAQLNQMWDSGHLHSMYDDSILQGNGFDRQQAMLQQITGTMEATNRMSVALAALRLEKEMKDGMEPVSYAKHTLESTMGVYTPSNVAPIFHNPIMRPIMQFHQMPVNLAISLYHNMYKALPERLGGEANVEARRTLAYQLGTAFAFGGMGGMPMDIPKVAGLASQALGGPAPSDYDEKFHEGLASMFGPEIANMFEQGAPALAGDWGPALGHRMGFNSDLFYGEPASGSTADIGNWIGSNLAGASASTIGGWHNTIQALEAGDYEKAAEDALPGSFRDIAKAYREVTQGTFAGPRMVKPASVGDAFLQTLGFQSLAQERAWAGHYALQKEIKAEKASRDQVMQKGTVGDMVKWNQLHPQDRITPMERMRVQQPKPGQITLGVKVPKWIPPARAQQYQQLYGVQ
jgi:hypothetical protein